MLKCPELKRLPKIRNLKSINFRNTIPGSPNALLSPSSQSQNGLPPRGLDYVDPTHPAVYSSMSSSSRSERAEREFRARSSANRFFVYANEKLGTVKVFPKALLQKPEVPYPNPPFRGARYVRWEDRKPSREGTPEDPEKQTKSRGDPRRIDMAMSCVVSKRVNKSAVVRRKMVGRIKMAISLIVTRGAYVSSDDDDPFSRPEKEKVLLMDDRVPQPQILDDWIYVFYPSAEVYRLPYAELVGLLRRALFVLWKKAQRIEEMWRSLDHERFFSVSGGDRQNEQHDAPVKLSFRPLQLSTSAAPTENKDSTVNFSNKPRSQITASGPRSQEPKLSSILKKYATRNSGEGWGEFRRELESAVPSEKTAKPVSVIFPSTFTPVPSKEVLDEVDLPEEKEGTQGIQLFEREPLVIKPRDGR